MLGVVAAQAAAVAPRAVVDALAGAAHVVSEALEEAFRLLDRPISASARDACA